MEAVSKQQLRPTHVGGVGLADSSAGDGSTAGPDLRGLPILGTITVGYLLSDLSKQDPVTVGLGAYITNILPLHNGDGIFGSSAGPWDITNYGVINATKHVLSDCIYLAAGGTITNAAGASIGGAY